ncbi:sit4-associated protein [Rhodotorula toruloides]|uniref:Sit4-associated protein n=1 Tax=Rhodotorula toruloides TaxID=5286 RepID=A0A511KH51_RHOTO|nr:sit4-associated protein [Rhodotorula toruloides]
MSFWKLAAKTLAVAPTDGIEGILAPLSHLDPAPDSPTPSAQPDTLSPADIKAHQDALDALIAEPELLSEIKSGSNQRLIDFLARKEVVLRLGGWVVWGLGRGFIDKEEGEATNGTEGASLESGILPDSLEQGKVPDEVLAADERKRKGMGGIPWRCEDDEKDSDGEDDLEVADVGKKKRSDFPRICTEVLISSPPSLTDTLFRHEDASSQPHTCPSPPDFLLPFWESILGSTEQQLASRTQQVGFWVKVNGALLEGPLGSEVLAQILTIPHLPHRLLSLLPYCSPINDLLLLLLRVSRPPSPLIPSVAVQAIRMLDPSSALGRAGHAAGEELLRGIIEICLAVPRTQDGMPGSEQPSGGFGGMGGAGDNDEQIFQWRDTSLVRKLADEKSAGILLDWMLAELDERGAAVEEEEEDAGRTPKPPSAIPLPESTNGAENDDGTNSEQARRDMHTSSLVSALSVFIELIRKNNSDFVEQHMLAWARRKQAEHLECEMLQAEGAQVVLDPRHAEQERPDDKGPSVVDLSALLSSVAQRLGGFQKLLKEPRSSTAPISTAGGKRTPLTLERFRICEFYAELLHCSNMSLLNRSQGSALLYDEDGHLARGWQATDDLASALAGPAEHEEEDDLDQPRPSPSPEVHSFPSTFSTSPNDHAYDPYSGQSTPSGRESLDEESGGVLTKFEANQLRAIIAAAEDGGVDEEGEAGQTAGDAVYKAETPSTKVQDRRRSRQSLSADDERDLPPTPSVYSETSRQLPAIPLPPGPMLKSKFIEHGVVPMVLSLFFEFPWHNFLHNVVFDLLQQIFHGRLDRSLDRQLAESVFVDGRLCHQILEANRRQEAAAAERPNMRLGYIAHVTLIAEETVKLFQRFPELYNAVESAIPQPEWEQYVSTTLRETRERDMAPFHGAGNVSLTLNKAPSSSSLSDEDDEFPMNSARAMRAMEAAGMAGGGSAVDEGAFGEHGKPANGTEGAGSGSLTDQFSRYLAHSLTSDRTVGSSDEDDEDDNWLGGSRFDPGDVDFELDASEGQAMRSFGFDDRFDAAGPSALRFGTSDSDEENDWAPFEGASSARPADAFGSDDFIPTIASASAASTGGFGSSFNVAPASSSGSKPAAAEDDDFGDFEAADASPSIEIPTMDSFDDFDFGEQGRLAAGIDTSSTFGGATKLASLKQTSIEEDDGSARFGRLSLGEHSNPNSPARNTPNLPSIDGFAVAMGADLPDADRATSPGEPLGPSMHPGAHLTPDGQMIEAEVEGKKVRVPADDIVLAHRRHSSSDGSSRRASSENVRD